MMAASTEAGEEAAMAAGEEGALFPGAEVWVEADTPGEFRRGILMGAGGEEVTVDFADFEDLGAEEVCARSAVWPANEADLYVDDLAALVHLSPATIVDNLRTGLERGHIYSWVGSILLALNPMRPVPDLYTADVMSQCRDTPGAGMGARMAHPFVLAELALRELLHQKRCASFVVSGESGAGKTETSRQLLNYCLWRAKSQLAADLSERLLQASSIVELFGSAATLHNANSSRVGRYLVLDFAAATGATGGGDPKQQQQLAVRGARLQTFLLERSRVVSVAPRERGFHVFYGLLRATESPGGVASALHNYGRATDEFGYLRPGLDALVGRDDAEDFAGVVRALAAVGLPEETVCSVTEILASILLLGNLSFEQDEESEASRLVAACAPLTRQLASWLGADLSAAFTQREIQPGGFAFAAVTQTLSATAAARARDAVARALYSGLFAFVVERVNGALDPDATAPPGDGAGEMTIGLLDIFGFERFEANSLEQLLINFANERLHQHFLTCVFDAEHEIYAAEGVRFPEIAVPSNAEVISLIGDAPVGLLSLLDDQSALQTPSDEAFCTAAFQAHARSVFFLRPKQRRRRGQKREERAAEQRQGEFVVRHFAGSITYQSSGFVEKNTDKLPADAKALLTAATKPLVAGLFSADGATTAPQQKRTKGAHTVSFAFGESLRDLARRLGATKSYFIRCVRPRGGVHAAAAEKGATKSRPNVLEGGAAAVYGGVVLPQLEASGVLEAVNLMTLGFPTRIPYADIHARYGGALPEWASGLSASELVEAIAMASDVASTDVAYGTSSLFCKPGKAAFLERLLGAADGSLDDPAIVHGLHELLETFERKRRVMPVVRKNLHMWVHRRRFLAYKESKRNARARLQRVGLHVGKAEQRRRALLLQLQRQMWAGVALDRQEKHDAATRIQLAFAQRRDRIDQADAEAEERQKRLTSLFRAAARASLAFASHGARLRQAASEKQDGVFGGSIVHAGYLRLAHLDGASMAPVLAPPGEYYCVLLSSRVLLCFEAEAAEPYSFNPSTGEAVGCRPLSLEKGALVRLTRKAKRERAAESFELTIGGPETVQPDGVPCTWVAAPSIYEEGDHKAVAHGVLVWVQRLSATMVPEEKRATRATLTRTTSSLLHGDDDGDDDDDVANKEGAPGPAHMAGKWADGCFYRGDGVIAYYAAPCPDDPYK